MMCLPRKFFQLISRIAEANRQALIYPSSTQEGFCKTLLQNSLYLTLTFTSGLPLAAF